MGRRGGGLGRRKLAFGTIECTECRQPIYLATGGWRLCNGTDWPRGPGHAHRPICGRTHDDGTAIRFCVNPRGHEGKHKDPVDGDWG